MPAAVPLNPSEIADEKRETAGSSEFNHHRSTNFNNNNNNSFNINTIILGDHLSVPISKPEAIVRPLRRREPSDDEENRSPELQSLEAQIIDKLTKLEKPPHKQQLQKQSSKDSDKRAPLKDIKKGGSSKEVSLFSLTLTSSSCSNQTNLLSCLLTFIFSHSHMKHKHTHRYANNKLIKIDEIKKTYLLELGR